jgi:hypothetical protein
MALHQQHVIRLGDITWLRTATSRVGVCLGPKSIGTAVLHSVPWPLQRLRFLRVTGTHRRFTCMRFHQDIHVLVLTASGPVVTFWPAGFQMGRPHVRITQSRETHQDQRWLPERSR